MNISFPDNVTEVEKLEEIRKQIENGFDVTEYN